MIVDDKFAVKDNDYVYAKCRKPNELWVQLIEKAYSKLHNCYQALTSGDIAQGLADMTSWTADKMKIEGDKLDTILKKDELW